MKQFFTFIKKEFAHVFRDRKTLLMLFGMPVAQIMLFGFALSNEIKNTRIVIADYAKDDVSQQIISKIEASSYFEVEKMLMSQAEIETAFKKGKVRVAVVFPEKFQQDLLHSGKAQIQVIADASDPNAATTLTGYLNAIIS